MAPSDIGAPLDWSQLHHGLSFFHIFKIRPYYRAFLGDRQGTRLDAHSMQLRFDVLDEVLLLLLEHLASVLYGGCTRCPSTQSLMRIPIHQADEKRPRILREEIGQF